MTVLRNQKLNSVNYELKVFLKSNDITYAELGSKVGVSSKTIYRRLKTDLNDSQIEEIKRIAQEIIDER